ncbi:putative Vacuolar protein sorting/targeting protein 10 [Glarea lozoyensis 74030]|uniref:Vacuolar protein sorting/targeting protein 10 n=1 Tax=Glarea lozoyensis (strain ATCC 74030 / MF5533) TaxID=1104152 RepID=H0EG59_GLAL7|nr:putative Vacuolar protein sorting/targeting protein 10 [Glarea lozoyensis 74030]
MVDFEKVSGIQGIFLVNTVENYEQVEKKGEAKKIKTQISFDDGRTFQGPTCKDEELHLHSVTDLSNSGRVFSSPAPGIVMGIGNTGKYLGSYEEGNVYVSDDAGLTWIESLKGPHKYEIGDQGSVLVAINDKKSADEIKYSLNHGKDWKSAALPEKVRPVQLTTTKDSTSLKFLLEAVDAEEAAGYIIALDFADMHEAECKKDDIETWVARKNKDGEPSCLMGHTQSYSRRKPDADCFMKETEFKDPEVITENCDCTDDDFECDFNFVRSADRKECNLAEGAHMPLPEGACKNPEAESTFKGSSGWRKIPGNTCKRTSGEQKDDPVERKCTESANPDKPASGAISKTEHVFPGKLFYQKVYLERTDVSTQKDETVIVHTDAGFFISHDHGKTWEEILKDKGVEVMYAHQYFKDVVYFLTRTKKVYYSIDRGDNIRSFDAPTPPIEKGTVMEFHWKHKDWFIWMGAKNCGEKDKTNCHAEASVTRDRGDEFTTIQRYVRRCEFVKEEKKLYTTPKEKLGKDDDKLDSLIYCEAKKEENNDADNPWVLRSSENFFLDDGTVQFSNVVEFATMSEFIVVATRESAQAGMQVNASVDGRTFSSVQFPSNFQHIHQSGYTVLDSSTHSIFLHVTEDNTDGHQYGAIIKSNSNGTSYVLSLPAVDRDTVGYVDFEKTFGLQGVALANVVANYDSKNFKKEKKKLKTMITHNDGAEWTFLKPPTVDADGKKFCTGDLAKCSLNVHGYTEREDKSHTYSSSSATGLMLATGNVGEYLQADHDTFITADAGVSWSAVKKGKYMWEYGDQGSIIVIVKDGEATKTLHYTRDEGKTWEDFEFSDKEVKVVDLSTLPSDNSRNFLIWTMKDGKPVSINIDFSGLTNKQCVLDENDPEAGDYYLWTPLHPNQEDNCLFGHVSQYHRKKTTSDCYNGKMIPGMHNVERNCACTRRDFECASGVGIFFAIIIPIAVAAGVGWYVWRNWASKFGQIRLGEQSSFDGEAPYIKYPVLVVAGIVAVVQALPLLVSSLWRSASTALGRSRPARFTTRDSFARGRGDYAVVDEDEGELLGDESDEEV